jgi:trigger factor
MLLTEVKIEKVEPSIVALDVEVSAQDVEQAVRAVYRDLMQRTNVSGFRKGKIPREILKQRVGSERIRREVVDRLVPPAYDQVIKEQNLEPLEQASIENVEFGEDQPLRFKARVMVKPEVALGEYKGVSALKSKVAVTDEEVEKQLERLREDHAAFEEVQERGIQNGDVVTMALEVYVDGVPHHEGRQTLRPFVVGENQLTPTIDDQLLGMKAEEERRFPVTYPPDFNDESLAGKDAEFFVRVVSVKQKVLPELNDAFAHAVGDEFNDLEQLRQHVRQRLTDLKQARAQEEARQQVIDRVVSSATVELPERLIERRAARKLRQVEEEFKRRGVTLEDIVQNSRITLDELRRRYRAEAERELQQELVLEAVAKQEGIAVEPQELESELVALAEALKQDVEQVRQQATENGTILVIESSVRERKAAEWLVSAAHVTEDEEATSG